MKPFTTWLKSATRSLLIFLGTILISLPPLAICLLLTLAFAFWVNDLMTQNIVRYVSRRVMLVLVFPGCLGSLALNALIIYCVNRYLENRLKKPGQ